MIRAVAITLLVSCAGSGANQVTDGNHNSDASSGDARNSCDVAIKFDPFPAYAGDHVHATALVANAPSVLDYAWRVDGVPVTSYEAADHSAIGYDVPTATNYVFMVTVSGSSCSQESETLNVVNPTGQVADYRLRVVPMATLAPPQDVVVQVHGGTSFDRSLPLDPGAEVAGFVKNAGVGVPAYLKFTPLIGPPVEAFSAADGSFDVRLLLQPHTVLVVPSGAGLAPRLLMWMPGVSVLPLSIDAGSAVTGAVRDPSNSALAGAKVQLIANGVPSTITTTAGDGSFTVRAVASPGAQVTVTVTPPTTSGLARLTATAAYDLTQTLQISYAGSPATCDLAATPVKRAGVNQAGAQVTLVGAIAGTFGSIATGGISQPASGSVLVATTANGGGTLPSTIVPRAPLSAVVELAPGDLAVASIDTSTCAPQTITTPPMVAANGVTQDNSSNALGNVRVEATPSGALALANLVPVEASSSASGAFGLQLASGGHYDLRFYDPAGRAAPLVLLDTTAASVPSAARLPAALAITGLVSVTNPIANASVQVLCVACTGVDASRPIAATATDSLGRYAIAVPDPGTM